MSDQFVAEIRIFPFFFAPTGWAFCDGQLLPISQNTALFSLLGTVYGGDGKSTFALPNLQGCAPMQPGQGQGLSFRVLGEESGVETITLIQSEMPVHTHSAMAQGTDDSGNKTTPGGSTWAKLGGGRGGGGFNLYHTAGSGSMSLQAIAPAGGNLPHNNMQPYLTLNFCIAMQGIYPARP